LRRAARSRVEVLGSVGDGEAPELAWLDTALQVDPAVLWQAPRAVAPLSYRRHVRLDAVCAAFAARGCPVWLRRSGGGVAPQGPGILNLSLAWPVAGAPGAQFDRVYAQLCGVLTRALSALHIDAQPRPVARAFCDGRFNLAVGARKIAGAAHVWRGAGERHAVLAHAPLLVDADTAALTALANDFEAALQSERRYDANAITTVAREWCSTQGGGTPPSDLMARVQRQIAAALGA
jgi:lipoate-protein ligase A